jgi:hypothetical protein
MAGFLSSFNNHKLAIVQGLYYGFVKKWMESFHERLLVLLYDDLRADPVATMDTVGCVFVLCRRDRFFNWLAPYIQVQRFMRLPAFDYALQHDQLFHEFQKGSQ